MSLTVVEKAIVSALDARQELALRDEALSNLEALVEHHCAELATGLADVQAQLEQVKEGIARLHRFIRAIDEQSHDDVTKALCNVALNMPDLDVGAFHRSR